MGVKCLIKMIKLYSPDSIQELYLNQLQGKTLAVDASIFIYEAKYKMNFNTESFVENFMKKTIPFINSGIKLIFVFDGDSPIEKRKTIEKRKEHKIKTIERINQIEDKESRDIKLKKQIIEVTRQDFEDAKVGLGNMGIQYFYSVAEAEASCARLVKEKKADFVLSNDSDTLAFGSSYIFKKKNVFYMIDLCHLLHALGFTQTQFITMCVLLGCDYSRSPKKINITNVFSIIKTYSNLGNFLNNYNNITDEDKKALARSQELFETLGDYLIK